MEVQDGTQNLENGFLPRHLPFMHITRLVLLTRISALLAAASVGAAIAAASLLLGLAACLFAGLALAGSAMREPAATPPAELPPLPEPSAVLPPGLNTLILSAARLRLLESAVVHTHDAVVILEAQAKTGPGRCVLYTNDAFCRMTGYTREEVVGRSLHFLRGPHSDGDTLEAIRVALATGKPLRTELRNYRKDGTAFWVDLSLVPVPDPQGGAAHWVMIQRDITERKSAESTIRRTNNLLRAIIDAFPGIINAKDTAGRYLVMNQFQAKLLGITPAEAVGKTAADIIGREYAAMTGARDSEVCRTGKPIQYEEVYPPGGDGRPWVATKAPLWSIPGTDAESSSDGVRGVVCVASDVGALKAAEAAVRRSEALFRGIFENTSAGVSLTDRHGRFVSCNPAFAAMLGRTVDDVVGLSPAEISHPDDMTTQNPLMAEMLAGSRDRFHLTKRYLRPDGQVVWVEVSVVAVRSPHGEFEHGLGVSLNVTERRALEDQLRQFQKMEAVGQMAGGIAHDFNNLLTIINGKLALMEFPENDPNQTLIKAVEQAANRARDLTGKLLGYARKNQLVSASIHPTDAFSEAVDLLRHTLDPRILMVIRVLDDCGPIQADPTLLSQVLLNLCLNARDAMPDGGTLTLSAESVEITDADAASSPREARPGAFIRLSVSDSGTGMTDDVKARVFEPFFTTKDIGKGTGLGLPMVYGIVKQHHGWVTCSSAPGAGTRLDMYFPPAQAETARRHLHRSPAPPADTSHTPLPIPSPFAAVTPPPANGRRTVLLVDDESMIRDIGRIVLERSGYRVLTAEDGVNAVDVFRREFEQIDLIVLDVTMPRMSGPDAFRRMVEFDPTAKVLFSTGYSSDDIAELDGAVGLLGKPYRPHELLAAVQAALDGQPASTE